MDRHPLHTLYLGAKHGALAPLPAGSRPAEAPADGPDRSAANPPAPAAALALALAAAAAVAAVRLVGRVAGGR